MASNPAIPVLIIGAGPAGLSLALSLLKQNVPFRIIDKFLTPHGCARSTLIHDWTSQALDTFGVLEDVLENATVPADMAVYSPQQGLLLDMAQRNPTMANALFSPQAELENVLRSYMAQFGGEIEWGTELVSVTQQYDNILVQLRRLHNNTPPGETVVEQIKCEWVIATDGAQGNARKLLGIQDMETTAAERMISANVEVAGLDREHWHLFGAPDDISIVFKPLLPYPLFQAQLFGPNLPSAIPTTSESLQVLFKRITDGKRRDVNIEGVSWAEEWIGGARIAKQLRVKRALLVGDSAHTYPEGLNHAIQDSLNIAWKLALVHNRLSPSDLLETYECERMSISPLTAHSSNAFHPLRGLFIGYPPGPSLECNYRQSPIVLDDRDLPEAYAGLRAGDRMPNIHLFSTPYIPKDIPCIPILPPRTDVTSLTQILGENFGLHAMAVFPGPSSFQQGKLREAAERLERYILMSVGFVVVILPCDPVTPPSPNGNKHLTFANQDSIQTFFVDEETYNTWRGPMAEDTAGIPCVVIRPDGFLGCFASEVEGVERYFSEIMSC